MLQDIYPHIYDNGYAPRAPRASDLIICPRSSSLLVSTRTGGTTLPRYGELCSPKNLLADGLRYLFSVDGTAFFHCPTDIAEDEGLGYLGMRELRNLPGILAFSASCGMHLARWYDDNRYCGRCATGMEHLDDARTLVCPNCGHVIYPKISPVVIIAIIDGDRLLLTKYSAARAYRHYSLVAGFVEVGETLEDAIAREVMEEVGLHVRDIRYYRSQPWGFTDSLLAGFFAEVDGSNEVHLNTDGLDELGEATWFTRDRMPAATDTLSLTAEMMERFRTGDVPGI